MGWRGDVNVPCTCTHVRCYAIGCFLLDGVGWGGDVDVNVPCSLGGLGASPFGLLYASCWCGGHDCFRGHAWRYLWKSLFRSFAISGSWCSWISLAHASRAYSIIWTWSETSTSGTRNYHSVVGQLEFWCCQLGWAGCRCSWQSVGSCTVQNNKLAGLTPRGAAIWGLRMLCNVSLSISTTCETPFLQLLLLSTKHGCSCSPNSTCASRRKRARVVVCFQNFCFFEIGFCCFVLWLDKLDLMTVAMQLLFEL